MTAKAPATKKAATRTAKPSTAAPVQGVKGKPKAPEGTGIPYHYNVVLELNDGRRVPFDGILNSGTPIVNQEQYNGLKADLARHYGFIPEKLSSVTIVTLARMDTLSLMPVPVPEAKVA